MFFFDLFCLFCSIQWQRGSDLELGCRDVPTFLKNSLYSIGAVRSYLEFPNHAIDIPSNRYLYLYMYGLYDVLIKSHETLRKLGPSQLSQREAFLMSALTRMELLPAVKSRPEAPGNDGGSRTDGGLRWNKKWENEGKIRIHNIRIICTIYT